LRPSPWISGGISPIFVACFGSHFFEIGNSRGKQTDAKTINPSYEKTKN
jgi:hypothetical protein